MDNKPKKNLTSNIISSLFLIITGTGLLVYFQQSGANIMLSLASMGTMGFILSLLWRTSGEKFPTASQTPVNANVEPGGLQNLIDSLKESNEKFFSKLESMMGQGMQNSQKVLHSNSAQIEKMNSVLAEIWQAAMDKQLEIISSISRSSPTGAVSTEGDLQGVASRLENVTTGLASASKLLEDASSTYQVNQASLQAGIEMLNDGLGQILEKIDEQKDKSNDQQEFIENLYKTLEAFHEKASQVLLENSLKTREMLLNGISGNQESFDG